MIRSNLHLVRRPSGPPAFSVKIQVEVADLQPHQQGEGLVQSFVVQRSGETVEEALNAARDAVEGFYALFIEEEGKGEDPQPSVA